LQAFKDNAAVRALNSVDKPAAQSLAQQLVAYDLEFGRASLTTERLRIMQKVALNEIDAKDALYHKLQQALDFGSDRDPHKEQHRFALKQKTPEAINALQLRNSVFTNGKLNRSKIADLNEAFVREYRQLATSELLSSSLHAASATTTACKQTASLQKLADQAATRAITHHITEHKRILEHNRNLQQYRSRGIDR
jgi:hypothetical protein